MAATRAGDPAGAGSVSELLQPNIGGSVSELCAYPWGMTLPSTYADQNCSIARALEVVGERWTLLIVRDAFYGVRRFGDFAAQLGIPRAVLTNRLKLLVEEGVLARERDERATVEYELTDKGRQLWPVLRTLMRWGDMHYSLTGERRSFRHDADSGIIDDAGRCGICGAVVPLAEIWLERGPGYNADAAARDPVSVAIDSSRLLLEPVATK